MLTVKQSSICARFTVTKAEIMITGTLSPASYAAVLSPLGISDSPTESKIDDKFLPCIEWMRVMAQNSAEGWSSCAEQMKGGLLRYACYSFGVSHE